MMMMMITGLHVLSAACKQPAGQCGHCIAIASCHTSEHPPELSLECHAYNIAQHGLHMQRQQCVAIAALRDATTLSCASAHQTRHGQRQELVKWVKCVCTNCKPQRHQQQRKKSFSRQCRLHFMCAPQPQHGSRTGPCLSAVIYIMWSHL
jgi:hypothetical protein